MRVIFFAAADHAVTLAYAMQCGIIIGGMDPQDVQAMCDVFDADPDARLVVTAAFQSRPDYARPREPAAKYVIEGYFGSASSAMRYCPDPRGPAPQTDWFLAWLEQRRAPQAPRPAQVTDQKLLTSTARCAIRTEGDEHVCATHVTRWGVNDDAPETCEQGE